MDSEGMERDNEKMEEVAADDATEATQVVADTITDELRLAVAEYFFDAPDQIDLRGLWRAENVTFVRANWWTTGVGGISHMRRSLLLRVEHLRDGWVIEECPERLAAA